jgi:hypothetical protein
VEVLENRARRRPDASLQRLISEGIIAVLLEFRRS